MAEAFLNEYGGNLLEAESAGLEPEKLNPIAVEVMKEEGIDISGNKTKSVMDFYKQGKSYDYVITVCDKAAAGRCPVFPGGSKKFHLGFKDPSKITGSSEDKLAGTRIIRDQIKEKIRDFIKKEGKNE